MSLQRGFDSARPTCGAIEFESPSVVHSTLESQMLLLAVWMSRMKGGNGQIAEDAVLRAASMERSSFLPDDEEFHKSILLVLSDGNGNVVGTIRNCPAAK